MSEITQSELDFNAFLMHMRFVPKKRLFKERPPFFSESEPLQRNVNTALVVTQPHVTADDFAAMLRETGLSRARAETAVAEWLLRQGVREDKLARVTKIARRRLGGAA